MVRWSSLGFGVALALTQTASAQYNNEWVEFVKETNTRLLQENGTPYGTSSNDIATGGSGVSSTEADVAWGDLNNDGWTDAVVVRKQAFTSTGKRTNILFMNESGVLRNRTTLYATDSSVGGDDGFNTPTNDRDVVITDVDQDGWMDFVTATTLSDGDAKYLGHPRVYMNKGQSGGAWLGMKFENARFPQLKSYSNNSNQNPRFCSVDAGDLTGDDYPDLYFGDYDSSGAGGVQQGSNEDLNDRLLINDGFGFFSDESQARMTSGMLLSAFGMATSIGDFNLDGVLDVMKDTALNTPQNVSIVYNNPANEGQFNLHHVFHTQSPYHVNTGDLNRDGRLDAVVSDDFQDTWRLNTNNDGLGRAVWGNVEIYDFVSGGDSSFASNNLIADLDNDLWPDVLICDVDVDIESSTDYLHIYHNRAGVEGDAPGTTSFDLRHERQQSSGGWLGVKGMTNTNLRHAHDVAVFDIDRDGDLDMFVITEDGGQVWSNQLAPVTCQADLGFQGNGPATLSVCGGDLSTGTVASMTVGPVIPGNAMLLFGGFSSLPTNIWEIKSKLVPTPPSFVIPLAAWASELVIPIEGGGGPGSLYVQWIVQDAGAPTPSGYYGTNAVRVDFLP